MRPGRLLLLLVILSSALGTSCAHAQQPLGFGPLSLAYQNPSTPTAPSTPSVQDGSPSESTSKLNTNPAKNGSTIDSPQPKTDSDPFGVQTKRILWIVPNFRSVSAATYLPPQTFKQKFWLATQESFDYSAFIYEGIIAGIAMASKSEPSFGQGAAGYGIYYAHVFADGTIENYMVEAIVPTLIKEDPRYYTLGHGGFVKRTAYSVSRVFITRTDAGNSSPNLSEFIGAGAAAGIGNLYYPPGNTWVKTYQRWISQMAQDAISNVAKEFWPDINRAVFHNKY